VGKVLWLASAVLVPLVLSAPPLAANPAPATPPGDVDLAADPTGLYDEIADVPPAGLKPIYIVVACWWGSAREGTTGVRFSAPKPACYDAIWLSDTNVFPIVIGNSQTGVSVSFGACLSYPIHVMTMNFSAQGTTRPCCYYWVRPDPAASSGRIEGSDCDAEVVYLTGGATIINRLPGGCPVPVEETTWGRVKSLYATE
jgi:hypothetical protein